MVFKGILQSKLLQRAINYRVILPKNYDNSKESYPIIYLLHGLFGSCDNWLELTKIKEYLTDSKLIIVLVEGENSWFSDSFSIEKNKFESYILLELIPQLEKTFRADKQRAKRAIVGLSMGGYGAVKFGLKSPEMFCFAGSMSGAFDAPNRVGINQEFGNAELYPSILEVFGDEGCTTRIENDIFRLISDYSSAELKNLPYFYLDCGMDDGFLNTNRDLAKLLQKKKIRFEFHEIAGGHDWDYWDKQIKQILLKLETKLD